MAVNRWLKLNRWKSRWPATRSSSRHNLPLITWRICITSRIARNNYLITIMANKCPSRWNDSVHQRATTPNWWFKNSSKFSNRASRNTWMKTSRILTSSSEAFNQSPRSHMLPRNTSKPKIERRKRWWPEETTLILWIKVRKIYLTLLIRGEAIHRILWEILLSARENMVKTPSLGILINSRMSPKNQFKWKESAPSRILLRWEMVALILLLHISRGTNRFMCLRKNSKYREPVKDSKSRRGTIRIWSKTICWKSFLITRQRSRRRRISKKSGRMPKYKSTKIMVKFQDTLIVTISIVRMKNSAEWSRKKKPRIHQELD